MSFHPGQFRVPPIRWSSGIAMMQLPGAPAGAGQGSWLRLVIPDAGARKLVRLVTLDEVMPVHRSVPNAIAAVRRERAPGPPGIGPGIGQQPHPVPRWRQEEAAAWAG